MPDVTEARHEMEQAERSAAKLAKILKVAARILQKAIKIATGFLDRVFHFSSGAKSYREITKNAVQTGMVDNLSKEDLREIKRYAKKWNMKYAIIKAKDDEVKKVNLLTKALSVFSKEKEEADYCIIYDLKYQEVLTKILKNVVTARVNRQMSKDPALRTDYNKDGVIDEKDLQIESKSNDLKADDLKLNHEYGTLHRIEFKDKNHLVYEISKEDYEKIYLESQVEVQSFSATVVRNLQNEEIVAISVAPKNQQKLMDVFLTHSVEPQSEMVINFDRDKSKIDPEHCYHIEMNNDEFQDFKEKYKETSYNSYKRDDKWNVIINSDSVKKNFEKSTKSKSLEELYKEIQPSKEEVKLDISKENTEVSIDDLDLNEIDVDIELEKEI